MSIEVRFSFVAARSRSALGNFTDTNMSQGLAEAKEHERTAEFTSLGCALV
jgi:hypothetical protein